MKIEERRRSLNLLFERQQRMYHRLCQKRLPVEISQATTVEDMQKQGGVKQDSGTISAKRYGSKPITQALLRSRP